jgi:hypothetical protein
MTAPLEGLFVDKAKYSENVGHHLVCWIFEIRRKGKEDGHQNQSVATKRAIKKSNEDRRHQRYSPANPTQFGGGKRTIRLLWKFLTTQLT